MKDLAQDLKIARNFEAMSDTDKAQLLTMSKGDGTDGRHELFKSTQHFDGPHHRVQHGFATESA